MGLWVYVRFKDSREAGIFCECVSLEELAVLRDLDDERDSPITILSWKLESDGFRGVEKDE